MKRGGGGSSAENIKTTTEGCMTNAKPMPEGMFSSLTRILIRSSLGILFLICVGNAQKQKELDKLQEMDLSLPEKTASAVVQPAGIALESIVNPEKYFVGPSDVIAVNIWMS